MFDFIWIALLLLVFPINVLWILINLKKQKNQNGRKKWAFFHPFCNDGGGGEKVLWCMIKALSEQVNDQIVVYSLEPSKIAILQKVEGRFGIKINPQKFEIVHVEGKGLLTSKGFLTMVLHLILPMIYAFRCIWKYQPDVFYDTTGYASTLVLVKLMIPSCTTAAYVHYPFISQDMIQKVREQRQDFNNSGFISRSPLLSKAKLFYYIIVLKIYKLIGKAVDFAQTNSTWTHGHMSLLWPNLLNKNLLVKLYPPCTVNSLLKFKKPDCDKDIQMMSLAQFRPEKQQILQLQVFAELLKSGIKRNLKFKICGTTRGSDDQAILQGLRLKAKQLNIQNQVQFVVNQPFSKIQECLQESWLGFHTMEAEHFGISVVEMLAAGLLVIAHNSAGPKFDIIKDSNYLADRKEDYAAKIMNIIVKSKEDLIKLSQQNRKKAASFSEEQFKAHFIDSLKPLKKES